MTIAAGSAEATGGSIEVFYALDFDRCLGKTDAFQALLESIIQNYHEVIDLEMVRYAHEQVRQTGGSFDTASYVRRALNDRQQDGDRIWRHIEKEFITAAYQQDMLEPYAGELLRILNARAAHYGILTYGGYEWQSAKLKAAKLTHIPQLITSHKAKGALIASWQQTDRRFAIPPELTKNTPLYAKHVVLVDDKPVSFKGLPSEGQGICVTPLAQTEGIDGIDVLPKNVTIVAGIRQAIDVLFGDERNI